MPEFFNVALLSVLQMDNPHGTSRITALAFAGASDSVTTSSNSNKAAVVCATASVDGTVKVWR